MSFKERSVSQSVKGLTGSAGPQAQEIKVTVNLIPGGLPVLLTLIFLVLKLTNAVSWSWVWVTSPLWISLITIFVSAVVLAARKKD